MWNNTMIESTFGIFEDKKTQEHLLKEYFVDRKYEPKTEEEKRTIEEFSMVTSAMAIMIYIAKIDTEMVQEEHDEIIDQMIFQLKQRWPDYKKLSKKYGIKEKRIIQRVFDRLMKQYHNGGLNIDETIDAINIVFKNNPYSKRFILRLCYYVAFADNCFRMIEIATIEGIARKMKIDPKEQARIKGEVMQEMNIDEASLCNDIDNE